MDFNQAEPRPEAYESVPDHDEMMQGRTDLAWEQLKFIEHHCQRRLCEAGRDLSTAMAQPHTTPPDH